MNANIDSSISLSASLSTYMITQNEKYLKGVGRYNVEQYQRRLCKYAKQPKLCAHCQQPLKYNSRKNKFCNHTCSASYTNKLRITTGFSIKDKTKDVNCIKCNTSIEIGLNASASAAMCRLCKSKYIYPKISKCCKQCNQQFLGRPNIKTCSKECAKILMRLGAIKAGKRSAEVQSQIRRSKNEIHFAELCKSKFTNVLTNEPIFNGWDTDVILPEFKIAILWNGAWHYKKITKKHSVNQVQNRDQIKLQEIKRAGYTSYVIKDLGSENIAFVNEQFNKFLNWQALVTIQA